MTGTPSPVQIQFATPSQLSLLRAALLDEPAATEAAKSWFALRRVEETRFGFEALDLASRRLLPLVYRNLKTSIPAPLRNDLRLVYNEYWADNQKRLQHLENFLSWFQANEIPTLVLKGMALSLLHYRDMAARPTSKRSSPPCSTRRRPTGSCRAIPRLHVVAKGSLHKLLDQVLQLVFTQRSPQ
jgi:hypothetical protein